MEESSQPQFELWVLVNKWKNMQNANFAAADNNRLQQTVDLSTLDTKSTPENPQFFVYTPCSFNSLYWQLCLSLY